MATKDFKGVKTLILSSSRVEYYVGAKETLNLVLASEGDSNLGRRLSEFKCYASIVLYGTEKRGTAIYNSRSYRTSDMYTETCKF